MKKIKLTKIAFSLGMVCLVGALCSANANVFSKNKDKDKSKTITIQTQIERCTAVTISGIQDSVFTIHEGFPHMTKHKFIIPDGFRTPDGQVVVTVGQCGKGNTIKNNSIKSKFIYNLPLDSNWIIKPYYSLTGSGLASYLQYRQ